MEGKVDRVQVGNRGSKYNRDIRYSHVIVYTGAAGYMSECQTDDLLVAMTAARNTAQLVTLILTIVIPDLRISSNTTYEKQVPRVGRAVVAVEKSMAINLVL